ncbi:MAG: hypothetical protein FWE74_10920 [Oscillospiraceae bacterium]|nr:hypothetical protein [Oscillospiraceae bacterium]
MKKLLSILVTISLIAGISVIPVTASSPPAPCGYVAISIEANTLGAGFIYEPVLVPFYSGESVGSIVVRFLGEGNYQGSATWLSGIKLPRNISVNFANIAPVVQAELKKNGINGNADFAPGASSAGEFLKSNDYIATTFSGWLYSVNGGFPPVGMGDYMPDDGDVFRILFSLFMGADIGNDMGGFVVPLFTAADKTDLIYRVAEINSSPSRALLLADSNVLKAHNNANSVLTNLVATQSSLNISLSQLNTAYEQAQTKTALDSVLSFLGTSTANPSFGNEWTVMALARGGASVPANYYRGYLDRVITELRSKNGVLPSRTDYSRLIIALSSIGAGVTNVGSHNLLNPLADFDEVTKQGLNGAVFALIALDTNNWAIPAVSDSAKQTTRPRLVEYILDKELSGGGFNRGFGDAVDPDLTAMVLQALAPYRNQANVTPVIERALTKLSEIQLVNGGFESWGSESAENAAQVIVALTALDIDPATDSRFVKSGGNPVTALLGFRAQNGGFTFNGTVNAMSSEQAAYALVAYDRFVNDRNRLYNMTDVAITTTPTLPSTGGGRDGGGSGSTTTSTTPTITTTAGTGTWAVTNIPRTALNALNLGTNIPVRQLRVPTGATGNTTVSIGTAHAGQNAVLVRFNAEAGQLEFVSASRVAANGNATVNVTATGDFLVLTFKTGDVTGTGEVDTGDALAVLRHAVGLAQLNSIQAFVANGKTGETDTSDALNILRYAVGLIDGI